MRLKFVSKVIFCVEFAVGGEMLAQACIIRAYFVSQVLRQTSMLTNFSLNEVCCVNIYDINQRHRLLKISECAASPSLPPLSFSFLFSHLPVLLPFLCPSLATARGPKRVSKLLQQVCAEPGHQMTFFCILCLKVLLMRAALMHVHKISILKGNN